MDASTIGLGNHESTGIDSITLTKADSIPIEDPQLAAGIPERQRRRQPPNIREHGGLILAFDPQDDNPGVPAGRIRPNIREVQVQGHQYSTLRPARSCDCFVTRPGQVLIHNRIRDEADATQDLGGLGREVLIDFEVHTVSSAGRSMEPSRASSAA